MSGNFCITGATGFIGQHLIQHLARNPLARVRCLSRRNRGMSFSSEHQVSVIQGDLLQSHSLKEFIVPGSVVVNLAFLSGANMDDNLQAARSLALACSQAGTKRLVHLSTAMVAGQSSANLVDEETPCQPVTLYERTKLATEKVLLDPERRSFESVVLRPTSVFGAGGKNLVKLAQGIAAGSLVGRYVKACFHGRRTMNLVSVETVVAALELLMSTNDQVDGRIYFVSDDEASDNNYRAAEDCLLHAFGKAGYPIPVINVPQSVQKGLLYLARRSNRNPNRRYSCRSLIKLGFQPPVSFNGALRAYADYLAAQFARTGMVSG